MVLNFVFDLLSGSLPFCLTLLVGGYLTFKTSAFQIRKFIPSMLLLNSQKSGGISSFSAMCNSLSAAIGTGNVVGVAAAVTIGGPGAVFWMWVTSFLGMAIKSGEIALGVFYREKTGKNYVGGPHIYIKKSLPKGCGLLAILFAVIGVFAAFLCGNMTQINAAVSGVSNNLFPRLIIGFLSALITFFVICGGIEKIATYLSKILPVMAVVYILLCLGVIVRNYNLIPLAFKNIFLGAFSPSSVTGGAVGSILCTVSAGASKGIFSNEAGVGTAAIAHSLVGDAKPHSEALYGIFEVFIDTLLLCSLTALTILTSGVIIDYNGLPTSTPTIAAFTSVYGDISAIVLNLMLWIFAISSVIGWATYGIIFCEFLLEPYGKRIFVLIYPVFCVLGSALSSDLVWRFAEIVNGVLVVINLLVMCFLSPQVITLLKEHKNGS